jgi:hypothetical protein
MGKLLLRLLKHAVIAAVIAAAALLIWYRGVLRPARDPNIGKRAYLATNDQYLGVVVGAATDTDLGEVWVVEPPSGYKTKYRKSRVVLKEQ